MENERPKVGVGVMIMKDGKVLLSKRLASHGAGNYAFPGGHLEHNESVVDCAHRETREEAGIEVENIRFLCLSNIAKYPPKHYINIGVIADWKAGEPTVGEPGKTEEWEWYAVDALPADLFDAIPNYIEAYKNGKVFYDLPKFPIMHVLERIRHALHVTTEVVLRELQ